jgi:hypothetical protein
MSTSHGGECDYQWKTGAANRDSNVELRILQGAGRPYGKTAQALIDWVEARRRLFGYTHNEQKLSAPI